MDALFQLTGRALAVQRLKPPTFLPFSPIQSAQKLRLTNGPSQGDYEPSAAQISRA